eukprot:3122-Eustigmatos_ZCMA.PRE.1
MGVFRDSREKCRLEHAPFIKPQSCWCHHNLDDMHNHTVSSTHPPYYTRSSMPFFPLPHT